MTKSSGNPLKLYRERSPEASQPDLDCLASLPALMAAFQEATGWTLRYRRGAKPTGPDESTWSAPVDPGVGIPPGHVVLAPARAAATERRHAPRSVERLAKAMAGILGELLRTQHALWQREAELAAGVPVVIHPDGQKHLAVRLQSILRAGAEAVGCQAAALYLLDEATTTLKLRSSWGLPRHRLTDPARSLRGAMADLEAMLGHVVALEDTGMFQQWNPPEDFPSAACVPVATPTTILGTLWVFCEGRRDFNERETNMLEVVAGRLASDLEREMLVQEGFNSAQLRKQLAAAERMQQNQFPSVAPLVEGWQVAGYTSQGPRLGGHFYDWFALPDATLAVTLGDATGQGIDASMSASAVRSALRSHGQYQNPCAANRLLRAVNHTLWTGSVGDQTCAMFCGLVDSKGEQLRLASAGPIGIVHCLATGCRTLESSAIPLGVMAESQYPEATCPVAAGDLVVAFAANSHAFRGEIGPAIPPEEMAKVLEPLRGLPAKTVVTAIGDYAETHWLAKTCENLTVLVVKRDG